MCVCVSFNVMNWWLVWGLAVIGSRWPAGGSRCERWMDGDVSHNHQYKCKQGHRILWCINYRRFTPYWIPLSMVVFFIFLLLLFKWCTGILIWSTFSFLCANFWHEKLFINNCMGEIMDSFLDFWQAVESIRHLNAASPTAKLLLLFSFAGGM